MFCRNIVVSIEEDIKLRNYKQSVYTRRDALLNLIERVELTENKNIIIKFRFKEP